MSFSREELVNKLTTLNKVCSEFLRVEKLTGIKSPTMALYLLDMYTRLLALDNKNLLSGEVPEVLEAIKILTILEESRG